MTDRNVTITVETARYLLKLANQEKGRACGDAFTADFECARKELQDVLANIDATTEAA